MKRFILLSLLVALIPSSANSWGVMGMSGGVYGVNLSSDPDLIAWYPWENNLTDASPNTNNLSTGYGTATYSTSVMVKNGTYSLDCNAGTWTGTISHTSMSADFPGLAASAAVTIGGWIRTSNVDATQMIAWIGSIGTSHYPVTLCWDGSDNIYFRIEDSTGTLKTVTNYTGLSNDTAYFVIGEWDGSNCRIYIGTEVADIAEDDNSTPTACTSIYTLAAQAMEVGGFGDGAHLDGYIDDFAIFDRVLTSAEKKSWQYHGLNGSH